MKNFNTPSEFCISLKGNYLDAKSPPYGIEMTLTTGKPGSERAGHNPCEFCKRNSCQMKCGQAQEDSKKLATTLTKSSAMSTPLPYIDFNSQVVPG